MSFLIYLIALDFAGYWSHRWQHRFVVLVALGNFMQSVQHVNARLTYGWLLERLIVSPAFHRRHHAIGYGHEGTRYGCNFGVLFPWWDMLFRTASWNRTVEPTGIRDQLPAPQGAARSYGDGLIAQQWYAFGRIAARLRGRHGAGGVGAR